MKRSDGFQPKVEQTRLAKLHACGLELPCIADAEVRNLGSQVLLVFVLFLLQASGNSRGGLRKAPGRMSKPCALNRQPRL